MLELNGNSLGKRQHQLNDKVWEAYNNKENFDEIKLSEEKSDVDRLFKIDLANLYKNIDYVIETLKCGDSLYISRALKCTWIYDDEFKHIFSPDYLHQNVFSFMSTKMKNKTLAAIARNLTDPNRAKEFYVYCSSAKLDNVAFDYLLKSADSVKAAFLINYIKKINNNFHIRVETIGINKKNMEHFFGNSIDLIELFLKKKKKIVHNVERDLHIFRYLFSFSAELYLNILESYAKEFPAHMDLKTHPKLGLRISKEIMIKHKYRVLQKPRLYLRKLNSKTVAKHSTGEDAKKYIRDMLPDGAMQFWDINYYEKYIDLFNLLPADERYQFFKQTYNDKYQNNFEMTIQYYEYKYYKLLTTDEQNNWALKHVKQKRGLFGGEKDFLWYKYVEFKRAFKDIKILISKTTCLFTIGEMLETLVESALNQHDLESLISYFLERHRNETDRNKELFIHKIYHLHNIFQFSENCWDLFYKLLLNANFLNTESNLYEYTMTIIVYNVIHSKKIPDILEPYCQFKLRSFFVSILEKKLNKEQQETIYQFFMTYFINNMEDLLKGIRCKGENKERIKEKAIENVHSVLKLMTGFHKTEAECPENIVNFVMTHSNEFSQYEWFKKEKLTEGTLLRWLKEDKMLLVNKLPQLKHEKALKYQSRHKYLRFKNVLRKLKIYFSNDIAKAVTDFFDGWLATKDTKYYNQIIFSLFQVADECYIINLLSKYAPIEPNIQRDVIDKDLLKIQQAICSSAYYSRPPVPLANLRQYINGDYVQFCLPMFNSYLVHLPPPQLQKYTESLLDTSVSIQKHGLRLAIVCYNPENLQQLVFDVWGKTNNVSLRQVIYKSLFEKIKNTDEETESKLYEVLKKITLDLGEDDEEELYKLPISVSIPEKFNGDYLQTAWMTVRKLSDHTAMNVNRKTKVIRTIASHINQIDKHFCRSEIIDSHIQSQLCLKEILNCNDTFGISGLIDAKWNLVIMYVTHFDNERQLSNCFDLLDVIMDNCVSIWDEVCDKKYTVRNFLFKFVYELINQPDYRKDEECKLYIVPIYKKVIEHLESKWPRKQSYCTILNLKLMILGRNAFGVGKFVADKQSITYDHLSISEVADSFANGIVQVLKEMIATEHFYCSFYPDLTNMLTTTVCILICGTNLEEDIFMISLCNGLTRFKTKEAYMLASQLLPIKPAKPKNQEAHASVISALDGYDDEEVKTFTYHKFVHPNFYVKY